MGFGHFKLEFFWDLGIYDFHLRSGNWDLKFLKLGFGGLKVGIWGSEFFKTGIRDFNFFKLGFADLKIGI